MDDNAGQSELHMRKEREDSEEEVGGDSEEVGSQRGNKVRKNRKIYEIRLGSLSLSTPIELKLLPNLVSPLKSTQAPAAMKSGRCILS